ncbi:MAG: hypothetical protein JW841_11085, partial [Deltaproteobacteria bacterium]|nr:hypothetical protein [Deltaproteobacteria bacterium]
STAGSATTAGTASDVTFNYADSTSKGGAANSAVVANSANDLNCTGCVSTSEVDFYVAAANASGQATNLAANTVGSAQIADNSIAANDIASSAVGTDEIASGAVTNSKVGITVTEVKVENNNQSNETCKTVGNFSFCALQSHGFSSLLTGTSNYCTAFKPATTPGQWSFCVRTSNTNGNGTSCTWGCF